MDILDLMQRALDRTNDPDAIFALDRGITEIERLREQLKYSNEFREIMNEERCDALEENERLREALHTILCNTDPHAIRNRDYDHLAKNIFDCASAALKEKE